MTLPDITAYIPKVELPFDLPTLLHPAVVHFMIAIPVIVLLMELVNLIAKKKAVGVTSFMLLLLTVVVSAGAYFTGLVDGKEGYDLLSEAGKEELSEHKLLGTYLLLVSVVVLLFKLLSAAMSSKIMKSLYMLVLIGFIFGIFEQGKDGGELVYEYGMNVEKVKELDDKVFELEEALEEAKEKIAQSQKKADETEAVQTTQEVTEEVQEKTPEETTPIEDIDHAVQQVPQEIAEDVKSEVQEETLPYTEPVKVESMPESVEQVKIPTH